MILVIGGSFQGKKAFAEQICREEKEQNKQNHRLNIADTYPNAPLILRNTSCRKVESAPWRVPLPTSSLWKTASTGTLPLSAASKKPWRQAKIRTP